MKTRTSFAPVRFLLLGAAVVAVLGTEIVLARPVTSTAHTTAFKTVALKAVPTILLADGQESHGGKGGSSSGGGKG